MTPAMRSRRPCRAAPRSPLNEGRGDDPGDALSISAGGHNSPTAAPEVEYARGVEITSLFEWESPAPDHRGFGGVAAPPMAVPIRVRVDDPGWSGRRPAPRRNNRCGPGRGPGR